MPSSKSLMCLIVIVFQTFLLASCYQTNTMDVEQKMPDPFEQAERLGKGINLGNALEAPVEGQWGVTLQEFYFKIIKDGGFDTIRVPIKWSGHTSNEPPYLIDEAFAERIDWVIDQAEAQQLNVVINVHHYDELFESPVSHKERFLSIWRQISERYKDRPQTLFFEPLNEPHGSLTPVSWNRLLKETIAEIRKIDNRRTLIIGTAEWGGIGGLSYLTVPEEERNAIVTFHYYEPFLFTHQGAEWGGPEVSTKGVTWPGPPESEIVPSEATNQVDWAKNWFKDYNTKPAETNPAGTEQVIRDLDKAAAWGQENNRPLWLGEFGAYSTADQESRLKWTEFVRSEAEKRGISWAYWEFASGFGVYDRSFNIWKEDLLQALIGEIVKVE